MGCGKQTHAPLPCPAQCIYRSIWSSTLLRLANSARPTERIHQHANQPKRRAQRRTQRCISVERIIHQTRPFVLAGTNISTLSPISNPTTYCPSTRNTRYDSAAYHGWPHTPRTLENKAADPSRRNAVECIVLPSVVPYRAVHTIIHHRHHTRRVAQERSSPRDRVQRRVQPKFRGRIAGHFSQSFCKTPRSTNQKRRQICHSRAIAEII